MKPFDYIIPDERKSQLRDIFPDMHEGSFINLVKESSDALVQYERSKLYHSQYHEKPSEHLRRFKLFKKHAKALSEWISKESEYQDSMFFGCDFLDQVDNDEAVVVRIANTRTALDQILYHEIVHAENVITNIEDMAKEPRIGPAFFRRELINSLVSCYLHAFGYLPSVYWDESRGNDLSEDCIQGDFIDFVEAILQVADDTDDTVGRHVIYKDCKQVLAERRKDAREWDWKNLL